MRSRCCPRDIGVVALDGAREVQLLVGTSFDEHNPEISPDGRWFAYESNESGQLAVYLRPFPDAGGSRDTVFVGGGRAPLWSRNGRELFYWVDPGTIMAVPVQTGATFSAGRPAVVVQNWFTELERLVPTD